MLNMAGSLPYITVEHYGVVNHVRTLMFKLIMEELNECLGCNPFFQQMSNMAGSPQYTCIMIERYDVVDHVNTRRHKLIFNF